MKVEKAAEFLKMLRKRMGNDLVYNFCLDTDNEFYLIVSPHRSTTRKFKEDTSLHRIHISKTDMVKQNFILANEINNIFEDLFVEKPKNEFIERVNVD